jgi:cation:H+ antiporter
MIFDIFLLVLGLALIVKGADWLTNGASGVARKFNISELMIGLTIVAFGTSTPEFVVSAISAINGNSGIAIGNVIGSNIANVLLILGITAMISPLAVEKKIVGKDIPWSILAATLLFIVASGTLINGTEEQYISRQSGLILLCIMATFLYYSILTAKNNSPQEGDSNEENITPMSMWKSILFIIIGLAGLVFGGDFFVDSASNIALTLGLSQSIVGLTIVAIGTSLPELATSIAAAVKGKAGMAIGNVVGSNIFNIFFILGTCATISPINIDGITFVDLIMQLICCLLIWIFARTSYSLSKVEGTILTLIYIGYVSYLIISL